MDASAKKGSKSKAAAASPAKLPPAPGPLPQGALLNYRFTNLISIKQLNYFFKCNNFVEEGGGG